MYRMSFDSSKLRLQNFLILQWVSIEKKWKFVSKYCSFRHFCLCESLKHCGVQKPLHPPQKWSIESRVHYWYIWLPELKITLTMYLHFIPLLNCIEWFGWYIHITQKTKSLNLARINTIFLQYTMKNMTNSPSDFSPDHYYIYADKHFIDVNIFR